MKDLQEILVLIGIVVVGAPLVIFLVMTIYKYQLKNTEAYFRKFGEAQGIPFELEYAGMPPLRLWIYNAKGDKWAKVKMPDGSSKWGRLRFSLFKSDPTFTFYDA